MSTVDKTVAAVEGPSASSTRSAKPRSAAAKPASKAKAPAKKAVVKKAPVKKAVVKKAKAHPSWQEVSRSSIYPWPSAP